MLRYTVGHRSLSTAVWGVVGETVVPELSLRGFRWSVISQHAYLG